MTSRTMLGLALLLTLLGGHREALAKPGEIIDIRYEPSAAEARFVVEYSGKLEFRTKSLEENSQVIIEITGAQLPSALTRRISAGSVPGPVSEITPYNVANGKSEGVRIVAQLRRLARPVESHSHGQYTVAFPLVLSDSGESNPPEDKSKRRKVARKRDTSPNAIVQKLSSLGTTRDRVTIKSSAEDRSLEVAQELVRTLETPIESRVYKGSKVTIESQNISVLDVFRLVGAASGLNIITTAGVTGDISLSLKDVPWDQLLDVVLQERQLKATNNGNVVRITTMENYQQELESQLRSKVVAERVEPVYMAIIPVNYAKADDIRSSISNLLVGAIAEDTTAPASPGLSSTSTPSTSGNLQIRNSNQQADIRAQQSATAAAEAAAAASGGQIAPAANEDEAVQAFARGRIQVDTRTNSLLVTHTADQIKRIRALVRELDVPTPQVLIEAKIVQASETFSRSLGVEWGAFTSKVSPDGEVLSGGGLGINNFNSTSQFSIQNETGGLFGLRLGQGTNSKFDIRVAMSEVNSESKVMASPRVIVDNNQSASITDGQSIAFASASPNTGTTTTFVDANLGLTVTPQVTNSGQLVLLLDVNQSAPGAIINGQPSITSKNVNTRVLVESGSTLVLGGVYQYTLTKGSNGIPLLMDLPILGQLFRRDSSQQSRAELLIFVTPRILDTAVVDDGNIDDEGVVL